MSLEGKAIPEYASLSGKIHTLVIDKTLSISGAAADAKAVTDAIDKAIDDGVVDKALEVLGDLAAKTAAEAAVEAVAEEVAEAIAEVGAIQADGVQAVCLEGGSAEGFLGDVGLAKLWEMILGQTDSKARIAAGHYVGTGTENVTIPLDFTPKAVFVIRRDGVPCSSDYYYAGLATTQSAMVTFRDTTVDSVSIVENGFQVTMKHLSYQIAGSTSHAYIYTNAASVEYNYIAIG